MNELSDEILKEIIEIDDPAANNESKLLPALKLIALNLLLIIFCATRCYKQSNNKQK